MSTNRSYPSTFVEMEVPEVETPRWQPPVSIIYNGFGKPYNDTDPLNYLTRCQDFMALHPLAEADLLATLRTVLCGKMYLRIHLD